MDKPFNIWNRSKKQLNAETHSPFFYPGEIWHCALGLNVGSEQDGKGANFSRPVIVIKKFNSRLLWIAPMTSTMRFYVGTIQLPLSPGRISTILLSQLRLIDSRRLVHRKGTVKAEHFRQIKKYLRRYSNILVTAVQNF